MKYHIEFIGLPGSGKTTYSRELVKILNNNKISTFTLNSAYAESINRAQSNNKNKLPFSKLMKKYCKNDSTLSRIEVDSISSFIVDYPGLFENIFSVQFNRIQSRTMRYVVISYLVKLCAMYKRIEDTLHSYESVVIDEGFTYSPVRTIEEHNSMSDCDFEKYLDLIPKPDIIIHLICSSQLSEERISKRPNGYPGNLGALSIEKRTAFLNTCNNCIEYIINYMKKDNKLIVTINSSYDQTENIDRMKKQVLDYVQTK